MDKKQFYGILATVASAGFILGISITLIAYGRGYRFDPTKKSFGTNGLIAATSDPVGATLFLDGQKRTATNTNITLPPGYYTVSIVKNGYQTWEKRVKVQGEVVTRVDAMLFSSNPSLFALTTTGVINPILSPDGSKLAYVVPKNLEATNAAQVTERAGVWVLDLFDRPLSLNRDARQVLKNETVNTEKASLSWSPDSKQILVTTEWDEYYTINPDTMNETATLVPNKDALDIEWLTLKENKDKEKLTPLKETLMVEATSSMNIIAFAPDENKILYEAKVTKTIPMIIDPPLVGTNTTDEIRDIIQSAIYVYDIKEDRNYLIDDKTKIITPSPKLPISQSGASPIQWLPSNRHLLITGKDKVDIMDYDGTNRKTVYAGPFWDGFVAPWSNAGRIVILTTLNPGASSINNLYAVNIR